MKFILSIFFGVMALATASSANLHTNIQTTQDVPKDTSVRMASTTIRAPRGSISALVADTDALRQHGLSDRESLSDDMGMIFMFPESRTQAFWMKDMHFPLDIIWIDANKRVVGIADDLSPDTYPEAFVSPVPVMYVLEVNAGQAAHFGIEKGIQLSF